MLNPLIQIRLTVINRHDPILLHDNTRPPVATMILQELTGLAYETLPHRPYSPRLSPTDTHFFKHLDIFSKISWQPNLQSVIVKV